MSIIDVSRPAKDKRKINVFYSYAREDESFVHELEKQLGVLKRLGIITTWHDRKINAGELWEERINEHLESSQVILFIVSADFVASEYCWKNEMVKALQLHELQKAVVVPIIVRDVAFLEKTPFAKLQMLPKDAKPIVHWERREEAWAQVAKALGNICDDLQQRAETIEDDGEARRIFEQIAADAKRQQVERRKILEDVTNQIFSLSPETKAQIAALPISAKWSEYFKSESTPTVGKGDKSRGKGSIGGMGGSGGLGGGGVL